MGEKKKGGRNKKGGREGKLLESQGDANSVLVAVLSCSVMSSSLLPHGCNPPGTSVHGISQARILEWVSISFSRNLPDPGSNSWLLH